MRKLACIFIDGLGLGENDERANPVVAHTPPLFSSLLDGHMLVAMDAPLIVENGAVIPTDATLGVKGIPQSATGQTTIFTGVNASAFLGYHLSAFPNETLAAIIREKSIMKTLKAKGVSVTSANLYSKKFFKERGKKGALPFPVSTLTIKAAGVPFRFFPDFDCGKAVFADIVNELLRKRGYDIPRVRPEEAARNFALILAEHDFVFFEYFLSDVYGHKGEMGKLLSVVDVLNRFVEALFNAVDRATTSLLIVSDHGNMEDISLRTHTMNKVPTIILTRDPAVRDLFLSRVTSLTDITPAIEAFYALP